jgi:hypothetical protein
MLRKGGFETDGIRVKPQLLIQPGGRKASLKPLLRRQLFFLDPRGRLRRRLLLRCGVAGGGRCRVRHSIEGHIQEPLAQPLHCIWKMGSANLQRLVN